MTKVGKAVFKLLGVGLIALGMTGVAHAWGEEGHRITGLVAQRLLTPQAKARVKALMGTDDLGTMSLYLDKQKLALDKKIPGSRQWHYDDRPVCAPDTPKTTYCPNGNCASVQIIGHYRDLIDQHSTDDARRFAIFSIVHLVGDIHQPLHASDHEDRGGNDVRVSFTMNGHHKTTNLHSAWDTGFVAGSFNSTDERVVAQKLVKDIGKERLASWQKGAADKWLAETFELAKVDAYGQLPDFACDQQMSDQTLELSDDYVNKAKEIVPTQLAKAGARIAYLLNRAFAK